MNKYIILIVTLIILYKLKRKEHMTVSSTDQSSGSVKEAIMNLNGIIKKIA